MALPRRTKPRVSRTSLSTPMCGPASAISAYRRAARWWAATKTWWRGFASTTASASTCSSLPATRTWKKPIASASTSCRTFVASGSNWRAHRSRCANCTRPTAGSDAMTLLLSRRDFLGYSVTVGGGLLLAGCGPSDNPGAGVGNDQPRYGGRLRLGILDGNQSGNLDAHKPVGSGIVRGFALYSKLWEWDEHMQPRLALAEFAEPNADASQWTLRLRQGLEFHNGKTIDADDLIFSIRRLTDPQLASPYAALLHWVDRDNLVKVNS